MVCLEPCLNFLCKITKGCPRSLGRARQELHDRNRDTLNPLPCGEEFHSNRLGSLDIFGACGQRTSDHTRPAVQITEGRDNGPEFWNLLENHEVTTCDFGRLHYVVRPSCLKFNLSAPRNRGDVGKNITQTLIGLNQQLLIGTVLRLQFGDSPTELRNRTWQYVYAYEWLDQFSARLEASDEICHLRNLTMASLRSANFTPQRATSYGGAYLIT